MTPILGVTTGNNDVLFKTSGKGDHKFQLVVIEMKMVDRNGDAKLHPDEPNLLLNETMA